MKNMYIQEIWHNNDKKLIEEKKVLVMLDLPLEELKKLSKTKKEAVEKAHK